MGALACMGRPIELENLAAATLADHTAEVLVGGCGMLNSIPGYNPMKQIQSLFAKCIVPI
jgi:hypothetical protein